MDFMVVHIPYGESEPGYRTVLRVELNKERQVSHIVHLTHQALDAGEYLESYVLNYQHSLHWYFSQAFTLSIMLACPSLLTCLIRWSEVIHPTTLPKVMNPDRVSASTSRLANWDSFNNACY